VTVYRNDEFDIDEIAEFDKYCFLPVLEFWRSRIIERYHPKYGATKAFLAFALDSKQLVKSMENTI
jgi:hypothetical protein